VRLAPKTLLGRNALLIVALILLAEITATVVFRQIVQAPRAMRLAAITAVQIKAVNEVLKVAPAAARASFVEQMAKAPGVTIRSGNVALPAHRLPPRLVSVFLDRLGQELGDQYLTLWDGQAEPHLWVKLPIVDGNYWLVLTAGQIVPDLLWTALAISIASGLLAITGALLIQRRLNRPLQNLVAAAEQIGQGKLPPQLPVDGPLEVAAVSRSFNQMTHNLAQLEADRAVMLAGVSHDLRTPLTKMRLAIEILRAQPDAQLLDSMQKHIDAMDAIIGQFLAYARIGNDEPAEAVDLVALLRSVRRDHGGAPDRLADQIAELPILHARPIALRRLFANLMNNAEKYAGGRFNVIARLDGDTIEVDVADRGAGMTQAQREQATRPFVRLESARGEAAGGSGLGLAIAERVAQLHGGTLTLLAREGGGLIARVRLPLAG
jgi:two-component system, OmpR family, osmolarity sensor histidine kinase EnvZ